MSRPLFTAEQAEEAFWKKVEVLGPSECWNWTGYVYPFGYGGLGVRGKGYLAHRHSWEIRNGPIEGGLYVCHRCDNRLCVNPDHLFLGTHNDNFEDAVAKGRLCKKLTPDCVRELRRKYLTGNWTQREIAKEFGVHQANVWWHLKQGGIPANA